MTLLSALNLPRFVANFPTREVILHLSEAAGALGREREGYGLEMRDVYME